MPLIVFSHANSFPAATYQVLFTNLRERGFTVKAPDKFGHDPKYPVNNNWPHLVEQLHDFAGREVERAGERAFLVGHSLGGFLSLMCAAQHPALARGVLLLDSPLVGGWRASALGAAKQTRLVGSFAPGAVSRKRRHRWPDTQAALEHFRRKKAFATWDERVLHDYVSDCLHDDEDGQRALSFDRDIETEIYNNLPHGMGRLLRAHPLQCPVAHIGGRQSEEMKRAGMAMTTRVTQGRLMLIDGSHLFPMEKPIATAAAIEAALLGFNFLP